MVLAIRNGIEDRDNTERVLFPQGGAFRAKEGW
jgi:hypothetical protein